MRPEDLLAWSEELGAPFDTADVYRAGGSNRDLVRMVDAKAWHRLGRGSFVSAAVWAIANERARHRMAVAARLRGKDARWAAARRSAAVFHDLPLLGQVPAVPQLLRDPDGNRSKGKNRHERIATFTEAEREEIDGVAVSNLARTVNDLARQEAFRNGLIAADGALRRGMGQDELLAMAKAHKDWPGGWNAIMVARLANGLHETALESLSWAACHTLGLEMPEPQIQVFLGSRLIARVDGLWRARNTIGQADGLYKYNDRLGVIKDKKQDEELEDLGFEVARWGWDQAYRPEGVLDERLRRAFERGSRQQVDPRVRLVATTLEESLKWTGLIAS
jgi:hypothetical protein